jgi:hypothetical protein
VKKKIIILLFFLPLIWLSSCTKKSTEIDYNPNVLSSKDYIRGEDAILEVVNSFFKGIHDTLVTEYGYGYIDACDVSYINGSNLITFGYGTVNRMCQDGKYRRGYFYATFSGEVFAEGVTANIVTDSLFVDDHPVEVNIDILNLGIDSGNYPEYSLKVLSSMIILPDTTYTTGVSITTDFLMKLVQGWNTPTIHEDDVFDITGTASGIAAKGYAFSIIVQDTLVNDIECFWIRQGISQITVPSAAFQTGTIDYIKEDGCNNEMNFYFDNNLFYDIIK